MKKNQNKIEPWTDFDPPSVVCMARMNWGSGVDKAGRFFAHTNGGSDPGGWEPLFTPFGDDPKAQCQGLACRACSGLKPGHGHLNKVAWWTAMFAGEMFPVGPDREAARQWGRLAGLWHDLGKFSKEFQDYLAAAGGDSHEGEVRGRVDHATAGAQEAVKRFAVAGHFPAYGMAGHHSGLLDGEANGASQRARLAKSLSEKRTRFITSTFP